MPHERGREESGTWGVPTATEVESEGKRESEERGGETLERARETASEAIDTAREKVMQGAEQARESAAEGMETAAEKIKERTAGPEGVQAKAGTKLAEHGEDRGLPS